MDVKIYTLDYCPFCKRALAFLDEHNVKYTQYKIDGNEDEMRRKLGQDYGIENEVTVPQIIIDNKRIGGYTDLMAAWEEGRVKFS